jgi:signal transduction histidine kinase
LSDLDELLLGFRAASLQVSFEHRGTPRRPLPAGAELTAYRTIQEALTNVIKHGGPNASASVLLSWQNRGLQLEIVDDGRGAAADPPPAGGGNGLRGMGERISLYDGSLSAGPEQGGGFRVSAFLPYSEA